MVKVGDIVLYKLSKNDAEAINRRRTNGSSIAERIKVLAWPAGAQAHLGNTVSAGEVVPMAVTNVWDNALVNGQALLDGTDSFWVTSAAPAAALEHDECEYVERA